MQPLLHAYRIEEFKKIQTRRIHDRLEDMAIAAKQAAHVIGVAGHHVWTPGLDEQLPCLASNRETGAAATGALRVACRHEHQLRGVAGGETHLQKTTFKNTNRPENAHPTIDAGDPW